MKNLSFIILLFCTVKIYGQRDSTNIVVGDSKCGPAGMILHEKGNSIANPNFITGRVYKNCPGKEHIENATVLVKGAQICTKTNKKGLYGLNINQVNDTARSFSLVAFLPGQSAKEVVFKEKLNTPQTLDFALDSQPVSLIDVQYNVFRCFGHLWITGKIYDSHSQEPLGFASVGIRGTNIVCIADSTGKYALNIITLADTVKTFDLICTYVSYKPKVVTIKEKISGNMNIDLALEPGGVITCYPDPPPLTKRQLKKLKKTRRARK